jgi:hypothetical protein
MMYDLTTQQNRNIEAVERFHLQQAEIYEREAQQFERESMEAYDRNDLNAGLLAYDRKQCLYAMARLSRQRAANVRAEEEAWVADAQSRAAGTVELDNALREHALFLTNVA